MKNETAAEWVDTSELTPWRDNPRLNDGAAVDAVADSIKRFGFASPIIARLDGEVIAGHTRLKAALKLGLDRVPVRYMDLDPADAKMLALADNKVGEIADWDDELLRNILNDLDSEGLSLEGLGWGDEELDMLVNGINAVGDDEWGSALGDLPEGEKAEFQTMSFVLHDDQVARVKEALEAAKKSEPMDDTLNQNRNGNALDSICRRFLDELD